MNALNNGFMAGWKIIIMLGVLALLAVPARADIVSTGQIVQQSERERVEAFLEREGVEKELKALGISPELARERVKALSDEEVRTIAGRMDTLAAGGALGTSEWLLIIIAILLLIIVL